MSEKKEASSLERWTGKIMMGILSFLSVWFFTTVLDMQTTIAKLEQKLNDDKAQWEILKDTLERQNHLEVTVRFHDLLLKEVMLMRFKEMDKNTSKLNHDQLKILQEKIEKNKKKKSVEDFRDHYLQQQQIKK